MTTPAQSGSRALTGDGARMYIADFDEYRVKYQPEV